METLVTRFCNPAPPNVRYKSRAEQCARHSNAPASDQEEGGKWNSLTVVLLKRTIPPLPCLKPVDDAGVVWRFLPGLQAANQIQWRRTGCQCCLKNWNVYSIKPSYFDNPMISMWSFLCVRNDRLQTVIFFHIFKMYISRIVDIALTSTAMEEQKKCQRCIRQSTLNGLPGRIPWS